MATYYFCFTRIVSLTLSAVSKMKWLYSYSIVRIFFFVRYTDSFSQVITHLRTTIWTGIKTFHISSCLQKKTFLKNIIVCVANGMKKPKGHGQQRRAWNNGNEKRLWHPATQAALHSSALELPTESGQQGSARLTGPPLLMLGKDREFLHRGKQNWLLGVLYWEEKSLLP